MRLSKKILSTIAAGAMAISALTASVSVSAENEDLTLLTNSGPYSGSGTYISTTYKSDYYQYDSFEITYKYNSFDEDGTYVDNEGTIQSVNYADTFDFVVFNTNWGGWDKVTVGQTNPSTTETYTKLVKISDIETALISGTPYGINLQTGAIGDTSVTVVSLKLKKSGTYVQQNFTAEGTWVRDSETNTMTVTPASAAVANANPYNIEFSAIDLSAWENPTVKVTAQYTVSPSEYVQAEILIPTGEKDSDGNDVYEAVDPNYIKPSAGTYTFATEIPNTVTKFLICYMGSTVTKVEVFNNTDGNTNYPMEDFSASDIASDMGIAWNLGNSLESVDGDTSSSTYGTVNEKFWGNPKTTKCLIQAVKSQGFNAIRVPISYLDMIGSAPNYTINADYLARIKEVVDYAYDMGMYVIINIHNDGGEGIPGKWIDISTSDATARAAMVDKFGKVWSQIATYFKDYDQKLLFESANELMISGNYSYSPDPAYTNINALNQEFVTKVRAAGGSNTDRVLIIPGYNTNIDLTDSSTGSVGFIKPTDTVTDRLMLSVHYYAPDGFTMGTDQQWPVGTGTNTYTSKEYMEAQINKAATAGTKYGMPVFLGEYGPANNNNTVARATYCYWLNYYAAQKGIVTAYWDNGSMTTGGTALFNRNNYTDSGVVTSDGNTIISYIMAGYNKQSIPV
ncbi:cellulase family glycosylhydrolase [Ruminococcus sp. Marseille-P6503]|uniref:cellulase family glycosylhydrolase n=1 Tax=Ruminococcus sp. Marseille-P6503 TaxID=2364796 RepID=UPI000F53DA8D|nr:cellulase family glycosylhydrolase [Ruminococcus sp. Marseille-P6503]